jgi:membrane protease YdiL (CAAX protease family)
MALLILLGATIMTLIAYFAAFALTVLTGGVDISDTSSATVNQSIFNILRYSLMIIILGWFYFRDRFRKDKASEDSDITKKSFLNMPTLIPVILLLAVMAFAIQAGTDSIIYILSQAFPQAFTEYTQLMTEFVGSKSIIYILTVTVPGPIAEEILFRGLILKYCCLGTGYLSSEDSKENNKRFVIANIFQALLFALYHGNIIQGVYAFICGMLLGDLKKKTDSLFIPIFLHMLINGSLYIIPQKLFSSTSGSAVIAAICAFIIIASYVLLYRVLSSKHVSRMPS